MASIKVNDLLTHKTLGTDLFSDSENFMRDLSDDDQEAKRIVGGDGRSNCVVLTDGQIFCKL
jgi:hypothetical protein